LSKKLNEKITIIEGGIFILVTNLQGGCVTAHTIQCGYGDKAACIKELTKKCTKGYEVISYAAGDVSAYTEDSLVAKCTN